ncbi:MAG: LD-carboxypeptidase [Bryobacteraceae bacterium]|nr:LD-carboxypeptidase [Solibacteraceae bacterium]MCO5351049.1 LD-carboxypeptidase [Bryobacteraceae bacterium]
MERRSLLATALAAPVASAFQPASGLSLVKPPVLKPGDTVSCVTPSTFVVNPETRIQAERIVNALGLKAKFSTNTGKRWGYLGGSVEERVADLHAAFRDPETKAVFCVRGGYGAAMLLDRLDYSLIRRNPKILLGYSDITALHLGIHQTSRIVTLHGPTVLDSFNEYTFNLLKRALFEAKPLGELKNPPERNPLKPLHPVRTMRGGKATGALVGGNLTLISTTMGTPWEIRTEGKILFLEDVGEQPYSMDRMLTQLRLAGKFNGIKGLILGECADCRPREFRPSFESTLSLPEVFDHVLAEVEVPVVSGLVFGHTEDQFPLPLGVEATLDADAGTVTVLESHLRG